MSGPWRRLLGRLKGSWAPLLALVLVGAALRFYQIGEPEVWLDEIAVRADAFAGTNKTVSRGHNAHLKPVGILLRKFGNTPTVLRTWGALLSVAAIPVCFILGTWLRTRRFGYALALLVAANPYLILYAQDGNYYSGMFFYSAVQLAGFAALLRGGIGGGLLLILIAGVISYFNHPMSICLTAMLLAASVLAIAGSARLRTRVMPRFAKRIPAAAVWGCAITILAIAAIAAGPKMVGGIGFVTTKVAFGGSLTNVEFGFPFFEELYTSWGIAHFRSGRIAENLAWIPFLLSLAGTAWAIRAGRRSLSIAAFGWLCLLGPIATYAFIFNIDVRRGFYIRYLTFLIPLFLVGIAFALDAIATRVESLRKKRAFATAGIVALQAPFLFAYFFADLGNFNHLTARLANDRKPTEPIWAVDQWLRVNTWFPPAGLPTYDGPGLQTTLFRKETAMLYPHAFATMAYHRPRIWVDASWQEPAAADANMALMRSLNIVEQWPSAQGPTQNAILAVTDPRSPILLPHIATESGASSLTPPRVPFDGSWDITTYNGDAPRRLTVLNGEISSADTHSPTPNIRTAIPVVTSRDEIPITQLASWPDHETVKSLIEDSGPVGFRERDGSWDFVVYAPPDDRREIVLLTVPRRPADLIAPKGAAANWQTRPEMWLAVSVDGTHRGFFLAKAAGDAKSPEIRTGITLPPGNHRVSVTGANPRASYTPFNPWKFRGIALVVPADAAPAQRLEDSQSLEFADLGAEPIEWISRGNNVLGNGWTISGDAKSVSIDPSQIGPSGRAALRVELSADTSESRTLLSPPFAVKPGQLLLFSVHLSADQMARKEAMPCRLFADANGKRLPYPIHSNTPPATGSFWPGTWRRFVEVVPVPEGAASVRIGVTVIPRDITYDARKCTLWIDAFADPRIEWDWTDPVNPYLVPDPTKYPEPPDRDYYYSR